MELWHWSLERLNDTEMKARVHGAIASMKKFEFFFGCQLGAEIFRFTDNLSRALQNPSLSATDGQVVAGNVVKLLEGKRNDGSFNNFWDNLLSLRNQYDIEEPKLPRKQKLPSRYYSGENGYQHENTKSLLRQHYYESYDNTISNIRERFNQPDFKVYASLQSVILKALAKKQLENDLEIVHRLYSCEIDMFSLRAQLELLPNILELNDEITIT